MGRGLGYKGRRGWVGSGSTLDTVTHSILQTPSNNLSTRTHSLNIHLPPLDGLCFEMAFSGGLERGAYMTQLSIIISTP